MPSYVYIGPEESPDFFEVERADIEGCNDPDQLNEWRDDFDYCAIDIRSQVEARTHCGTADEEWLRRTGPALAFHEVGRKLCEKRLKALGHLLRDDERTTLNRRISQGMEANAKLRSRVDYGDRFMRAAQAQLPPEIHAAILAHVADSYSTEAAADAKESA
jgi:hypothetical protein